MFQGLKDLCKNKHGAHTKYSISVECVFWYCFPWFLSTWLYTVPMYVVMSCSDMTVHSQPVNGSVRDVVQARPFACFVVFFVADFDLLKCISLLLWNPSNAKSYTVISSRVNTNSNIIILTSLISNCFPPISETMFVIPQQ
jgi:hypothetical protein